MMTEQEFLQALRDSPADTSLKLVYADWLEEQGRVDEAMKYRSTCPYCHSTMLHEFTLYSEVRKEYWVCFNCLYRTRWQ